jgi:hypothetical protein
VCSVRLKASLPLAILRGKLPRSPSRRSRSTTSSDTDSAEETKAMEISDSDDSVAKEVFRELAVVPRKFLESRPLLPTGRAHVR